MSKKQVVFIVIIAVACSWVFDAFFGRTLTAELSTLPILNRWHILSPQTPIVITKSETVRVSDSGDIAQASQQINSKLSSVVLVSGNADTLEGASVNLTSDGGFVTAAAAFPSKAAGNYYVVLSDGTVAPITSQVLDPATSLIFFRADLKNISAVSIGSSSGLAPGEQILFAQNSLQNFVTRTISAEIISPQEDEEGLVFQSDFPRRSFTTTADSALASGEAVADTNGNLLGVWNGSAIISAEVLKQAMSLYFNNPSAVIRPAFGFSYEIITKDDSALTSLPQGAEIKAVTIGSPAAKAGLLIGDIITSVDGQSVSESSPLEPMLQNYTPGDQLQLAVTRGKQTLNLILTAAALK
jgi:S1-C subfamily serine protease